MPWYLGRDTVQQQTQHSTTQHQLSTTSTLLGVLLVTQPVAHKIWDPLELVFMKHKFFCVIQYKKNQVFSAKLLIISEYWTILKCKTREIKQRTNYRAYKW